MLTEREVIFGFGLRELTVLCGPAGAGWIPVCADGELGTAPGGLLKALESVRDRLL